MGSHADGPCTEATGTVRADQGRRLHRPGWEGGLFSGHLGPGTPRGRTARRGTARAHREPRIRASRPAGAPATTPCPAQDAARHRHHVSFEGVRREGLDAVMIGPTLGPSSVRLGASVLRRGDGVGIFWPGHVLLRPPALYGAAGLQRPYPGYSRVRGSRGPSRGPGGADGRLAATHPRHCERSRPAGGAGDGGIQLALAPRGR